MSRPRHCKKCKAELPDKWVDPSPFCKACQLVRQRTAKHVRHIVERHESAPEYDPDTSLDLDHATGDWADRIKKHKEES